MPKPPTVRTRKSVEIYPSEFISDTDSSDDESNASLLKQSSSNASLISSNESFSKTSLFKSISSEASSLVKSGCKLSSVLLAQQYSTQNIIGWWMSEKYDGYRAIWTGTQFVTRNYLPIVTPQFFIDKMPKDICLDGELWCGKNNFEACGLFRRKHITESDWKNVEYLVFDIVLLDVPFERRMQVLKDLQSTNLYKFSVVEHIKVETMEQVDEYLKQVLSQNGEGLMFREPNSLYEPKRSKTLLKMKIFNDLECEIIGYNMGQGKYTNKLGSFVCKYKDVVFNVSGVTDDVRDTYLTTHPIGTVITIKYNDFTKSNIPRFPRYFRKHVP